MIKINRKSIATKLSIIMFVIIIVQMASIVLGVLLTGIMVDLTNNAYNLFETNVENRKYNVDNELGVNYANIDQLSTYIETIYDEFSEKQDILNSDEATTSFLIETAPTLIEILNSTNTSGSFIILADNGQSDTHSSVYFVDEEPLIENHLSKDIVMLKGPTQVSSEMNIKLHNEWNYGITLDETNKDIFYTTIEAKEETGNAEIAGHWEVSPSIYENDTNTITYSIPLLDKNGNTFGIIGIEMNKSLIYGMLPNDEIVENSNLGYIIAVHDTNTNEIIPVMLQGTLQSKFIDDSSPLQLEKVNNQTNIYKIANVKEDVDILCTTQNLKLYNNDTPFNNENWVLIGLSEEDKLLEFSSLFINKFIIIIIFSLLLCIVFAFLVGKHFAKPIIQLSKQVNINNTKYVVALDRTGLSEIDDLSMAIENLNYRMLEQMVKTDKIIDMVNLPLGTFEYKKCEELVLCSNKILELLGFDEVSDNEICSKVFFDKIDEIKQNVEDKQNNIYYMNTTPMKWVKIVSIDKEDAVLGVVIDFTQEVLESHTIKFQRDHDTLTSLYNHQAFQINVEKILKNGVNGVCACVMLDLDNLKYINDTYGHFAGDEYIKLTAKILSENLAENGVIARISGDEFCVFLYNYDTKDAVFKQLDKMYDSFNNNKLILANDKVIKIRISGGISWYAEDSNNLNELIHFSDFALYQVKRTIKGEIREFNKTSYEKESFMLSSSEELNTILDNELIDYAFQPIVSAKTGNIYGYEALMRPQSSILSSPLKLLQIATVQCQLSKIERISWFKPLSIYKKNRELFNDCKLFINSIPNECVSDVDIEEIELLYSDILQNIVVEITENEKLDDEITTKKRNYVKKWNSKIALDDYGSGYNGDISLLSIDPDIVKLDMMMIRGIETDKSRQSIVQKLILYAKEQGIIVLAEGVETHSQMEYLVLAGVDLLQGYYISRPIPIPNFDHTVISKQIESINL